MLPSRTNCRLARAAASFSRSLLFGSFAMSSRDSRNAVRRYYTAPFHIAKIPLVSFVVELLISCRGHADRRYLRAGIVRRGPEALPEELGSDLADWPACRLECGRRDSHLRR